MKGKRKLKEWQQQAVIDAYLAGEKIEAIAAEFGIVPHYAVMLAKSRGHAVRPRKPRKGPEHFRAYDREWEKKRLNGWARQKLRAES
jgi:hypothetical protein